MAQRNKSRNHNKSNLRQRKSSSIHHRNTNDDPKQKEKSKAKEKENKLNHKSIDSQTIHQCPFECDCKKCRFKLNEQTIEYYRQYIIDNLYSSSPYRLRNFHFVVDLVLFGIGALYVVFVPYTKVEESFNMQATHDMLFYGYLDINSYDHLQFPGVVPRTFIGALILSMMVWPWKFIVTFILPYLPYLSAAADIQLPQQCQYLIRFALLFLNIAALSKFRQSFIYAHFVQEPDTMIYKYYNSYSNAIDLSNKSSSKSSSKHKNNSNHNNKSHASSPKESNHNHQKNKKRKNSDDHNQRHIKISMIQRFSLLFATLIIAQFHYLFYSSRLLPNCFALPMVTVAFAEYFRNNYGISLIWLAASTIFFRCDTIVIAMPFMLIMLIKGYQRFTSSFCGFFIMFIIYGIIGSMLCILCTILIDSWFWTGFTSFKWPEFEVLWYNTYENKSSNWGISPWRYYFFPLIPKMLLINTIFMLFSIFKIYPLLFVHEVIKRCCRKRKDIQPVNNDDCDNNNIGISDDNDFEYDEDMPFWRLILLFIDWESVALMMICFIFVFLYSFLPHKETRFIFFIIPPCTLLSTIGCIRLLTLWGFRGFANASFNLHWYKQNLYQRQKQLYYAWIPHELLLSAIVKKLVSIETPVTFIALRRYLKCIIKEVPFEIYQTMKVNIKLMAERCKIRNNNKRNGICMIMHDCFANLILPLSVFGSIMVSTFIAWYGVYEASYNYPGGVAITLFPKIVRNYKTNMTRYDHYRYAGTYYYNQENDEFIAQDEYESNNNNDDHDEYHHHEEQYNNQLNNYDENTKHNQRSNHHKRNYGKNEMPPRLHPNHREVTNDTFHGKHHGNDTPNHHNNKPKTQYTRHKEEQHDIDNDQHLKDSSRPRYHRSYPQINDSINNEKHPQYKSNGNVDHGQYEIFEHYDEVRCVHIGNLAAISGVTRFMTPYMDQEFRFSKEEEISIEQYAYLRDPCHLYEEMYSKICANPNSSSDDDNVLQNDAHDETEDHDKWNDDIYDEEYFEQRDDYLHEGEHDNHTDSKNNNDCISSIDYRYPTIQGFDYLITEYASVPGYYLLPHGVIYAKSVKAKSQIKNMINYLLSFFIVRNNDDFLEPALYVLKRETPMQYDHNQ